MDTQQLVEWGKQMNLEGEKLCEFVRAGQAIARDEIIRISQEKKEARMAAIEYDERIAAKAEKERMDAIEDEERNAAKDERERIAATEEAEKIGSMRRMYYVYKLNLTESAHKKLVCHM